MGGSNWLVAWSSGGGPCQGKTYFGSNSEPPRKCLRVTTTKGLRWFVMGQVPEQMDIGEFVRATMIDEREALAYATWWWWERQKGTQEKWRKLKVRLWDLVVSELCANVYHVIITPMPELVFRDPEELMGVALTRGWIFRYEGGNDWELVASVDRDGWERYKQVYRELKAKG